MPNSLSVLRERNLSGETRGMDYFDPLDLLAIKLIKNMGKTNTNCDSIDTVSMGVRPLLTLMSITRTNRFLQIFHLMS